MKQAACKPYSLVYRPLLCILLLTKDSVSVFETPADVRVLMGFQPQKMHIKSRPFAPQRYEFKYREALWAGGFHLGNARFFKLHFGAADMEKLRHDYRVIPLMLLHQRRCMLRTQTRVRALAVQPNHLFRDDLGKQIVTHHLRFILPLNTRRTTDHDVLHLVLAVQLNCPL